MPVYANAVSGVAVLGDDQVSVDHGIADAKLMGKTPLYVTVVGTQRSYDFSPYAQVVHSDRSVIVRAYGDLFVFPATAVTVRYSALDAPVGVQTLPSVWAPAFDTGVTRGQLRAEQGRTCPDCTLLETDPRRFRDVAPAWNALRDPWQIGKPFVPWLWGDIADADQQRYLMCLRLQAKRAKGVGANGHGEVIGSQSCSYVPFEDS